MKSFIFATLATLALASPAFPADLPNLNATLTKLKHKIKDAGDRVVIKLVVRNQGEMTPELPVVVALWLSDDQVLDDNDTLLA